MSRAQLTATFRALHVPGDPLLMLNPWDLGSAKVMRSLGAQALATTSSGFGFTAGLIDGGQMSRDMAVAHAAALCACVDLPMNGDFENGFGDTPEIVAETIHLAAQAGLAGVGIEDTILPDRQPYSFDLALARIKAAVEAARDADIVLTARADGVMLGTYDQAEALRRCQAFAQAGADVIYAPLVDPDTTRQLVEIGTPVNVLVSGNMRNLSLDQLAAMGVARVSIGGGLARATQRLLIDGTRQMLADGDFSVLKAGAPETEIAPLLDGSYKSDL